jgi:hypothetical protein
MGLFLLLLWKFPTPSRQRLLTDNDFLGYHSSPEELTIAAETLMKFIASAIRLYEQEREKPKNSPQLGLYVRRWVRWVEGGLWTKEKRAEAGSLICCLYRDLIQ